MHKFVRFIALTAPWRCRIAFARASITLGHPAQRRSDALHQLTDAAHLPRISAAKDADGKTSLPVTGAATRREAPAHLLAGAGLSLEVSRDRTMTLAAQRSF